MQNKFNSRRSVKDCPPHDGLMSDACRINDLEILPRTAFLIPVYNHPFAVAGVVAKLKPFHRPILIVDDGSTDETSSILRALKGVTVIRHDDNQGKGAALMTGFRAAAGLADWAITLDADGQHDPYDAVSLTNCIREGERALVVGKRMHMQQKGAPWTSRWGRRFSNFWVWACSGLTVSDSQSGFRLYPLPETLNLNARSRRFQYEVEILVLASWAGIEVKEAEISTDYRPEGNRISHFKPLRDFFRNATVFSRLLTRRLFFQSFPRRQGRLK